MTSAFLLFSAVFPQSPFRLRRGNIADEILCHVWLSQVPMYSLIVSSVYGIVAIAFERFVAVIHPIWYKAKFSRRMIAIIVVCVWLIGVSFTLPSGTSTSRIDQTGFCGEYYYFESPGMQLAYGIILFLIQYMIPLVCFLYFYAKMIFSLRFKTFPHQTQTTHTIHTHTVY